MKSFIFSVALATSLSFFGASAGQNLTSGANSTTCSLATQDDGSYYSVVGVQGTGVHPRMELRELEKDTDMWNLFLQAFAAFQAMDQEDKLSYYSISGTACCFHPSKTPSNSNRYSWRSFHYLGQCERDWAADRILSASKQRFLDLAPSLPRFS